MFCSQLNNIMKELGISGRELSELSGISEATISRYRAGERSPKPDSEDFLKLCRGLSLAGADNSKKLSNRLREALSGQEFDYTGFQKKTDLLFQTLSVKITEISKALKYDSSYISRIRNGQRRPAHPEQFLEELSRVVARGYCSEQEKELAAGLLKVPSEQLETQAQYAAAIRTWFLEATLPEEENPLLPFLKKLDEFDLNQYIKAIHFDELNVPSLPFQLPTAKTYYGISEMKTGELDFLKATALSRSKEPVFMCSDMQMDDMAADLEFSKKYMFGLAAMLKKGLKLQVVHNLNRPFHELMLGLECWIPLYMTGQIEPYYFKGIHNQVYCHFLNVSGAAALSGESVAGDHKSGKYTLTKKKDELVYYRKRADSLLKKSFPLMEIYREDSADALQTFLRSDTSVPGTRKHILTAPPIYSADEEFLKKMLLRHCIPQAEQEKILAYAAERREVFFRISKENQIVDELPEQAEDTGLSLSPIFFPKTISYTPEEYQAHMMMTKQLAAAIPNYTVRCTEKNAFRNIQISIRPGEYVMISKNNAPAIHFVIRHPILRSAIEQLEFPVL